MNRTEAAALASRKAQENRRQAKLDGAAFLLRDAGWVVFPTPARVVRIDSVSQFQRDVTLFTVEVPNGTVDDAGLYDLPGQHSPTWDGVKPSRWPGPRLSPTYSADRARGDGGAAEVKVPTLADGNVPTWTSGADQ